MTVAGKHRAVTVGEAAETLNLSKATIRLWLAQRRLGYIKLGRAVRIPMSEIERLLTEGEVPALANRR